MNIRHDLATGVLIVTTFGFATGCTLGPPTDANLLFPNAAKITNTQSDSTSTPSFTWTATGRKFIYVGVFDQRISVDSSSHAINNIGHCVWAWYSGLRTGREGSISFSDGVDVINGGLQTGKPVTPLISQHEYYWGVWAWDDSGRTITNSSVEMYILVN